MAIITLTSMQTAFFGEFRPLGVIPNLVLLVIILNGLHSTASSTVALALGGGLLLDLASGQDFGLRMAFFTLMALAVVVVRQLGFHLDTLWVVAVLAALGTLAFNLVILAGVGFGHAGEQLPIVIRLILAEAVVNCILIAIAHITIILLGGGINRGEPGLRKRTLWQAK